MMAVLCGQNRPNERACAKGWEFNPRSSGGKIDALKLSQWMSETMSQSNECVVFKNVNCATAQNRCCLSLSFSFVSPPPYEMVEVYCKGIQLAPTQATHDSALPTCPVMLISDCQIRAPGLRQHSNDWKLAHFFLRRRQQHERAQ